MPVLRHPVHSLVCLIVVFFAVVVLFIALGAEFLGYLFLIVYVGAIAILFLFVIMLLNVKQLTATSRAPFTRARQAGLITLALLAIKFTAALLDAVEHFLVSQANLLEETGFDALMYHLNYQVLDILTFATLLYGTHSYLFMLTALLLLTGMVGAIVLAMSTVEGEVIASPARPVYLN